MERDFESKFFEILYNRVSVTLAQNEPLKVAVAVSGGPDSMCLLELSRLFAEKYKVEIYALTVDHKLRKESKEEALFVKKYCIKHGIKHEIFDWEHGDIDSAIQMEARRARYALISDFCLKNNIRICLTGHILEDSIEQVFISLHHGGGIYNATISENSKINNIYYFRPLISFSRAEILAVLTKHRISFVEDPSNKSDKYLRSKIRPLVQQFVSMSDTNRIYTALNNISRGADALNLQTDEFIKNTVFLSELGYIKIPYENFSSLHKEHQLSVLRKLIAKVGRTGADIRISSLENILSRFRSDKSFQLGGCGIYIENKTIIIVRDYGRVQPEPLSIKEIWDNRFYVEVSHKYEVKIIDSESLSWLLKNYKEALNFDKDLGRIVKKHILKSLPCIFFLEKLVAIPHISFYTNDSQIDKITVEYIHE